MRETRKQLKDRLQAVGLWEKFVALRGKLAEQGMTPAAARDEALRQLEAGGEANEDHDEDDDSDLRDIAEYAEYRMAIQETIATSDEAYSAILTGFSDPTLWPCHDQDAMANRQLAKLRAAGELGDAALAVLDAAIDREFKLWQRVHKLEKLHGADASLKRIDDMMILAGLQDIAAVLAWWYPSVVIATLRGATKASERRYVELLQREQQALSRAAPAHIAAAVNGQNEPVGVCG